MEDRDYLIAFNMISGLGSLKIKNILENFDSPQKVFQAGEEELLKLAGIGKELVARIKNFDFKILEQELSISKKHGIKIITVLDEEYPELLKEIPDPPVVLYIWGEIPVCEFSFAIVGSRRASFYGLSTAEKFAYQLACLGFCIISGLARGIDSSAHRGALKAGGKTVAVLGSGLLNIYPPENKDLAFQIMKTGAVISEFALNTPPYRENFPRRNRIISGLSRGVLVVEAAKRSGALITADLALEQGREVFAIPGKVDSPTSSGTHSLIKEGAKLVECVEDILEELGIYKETVAQTGLELSLEEKEIISALKNRDMILDEIMIKTGMDFQKVNQNLISLQLKGIISAEPGGIYRLR
jgi:DNA processing protein